MQFKSDLRKAVGGVKNYHGVRSTGTQEIADSQLKIFQAEYRRGQGKQRQPLSPVTLIVEIKEGAIAEGRLWDSLKK